MQGSKLRFNRQWRDIEDFIPKLRANARGDANIENLDDAVLIDFVRDAAIRFVQDTKVLREYLSIDILCGVCDYPLLVETCENIIGVGEVELDECETHDCAGSTFWTWGDIEFRVDQDSDILSINKAPSIENRKLEVQLYVSPKRDTCKVDEVLYQRYHESIIYYALYQIHMIPNQPWSSVTRADRYLRLYQYDITEANERRMDRGMKTRYVTRGPWVIGGRRR